MGLVYLLFVLAMAPLLVHAGTMVNVTIMESAVQKGAVCLDGSPPAYYYLQGAGNGVGSNWLVFLEGGGWCTRISNCVERSNTYYGSSVKENKGSATFEGILDNNCDVNPDFCSWHKVFVHYCDGSSYSSDIKEVDPANNLTFRGARIFDAVIEEMLSKGMGDAQNAVLVGTSAGGLGVSLHCDSFSAVLPSVERVKCISDSGFFIRGEDLPAQGYREAYFANVVATHELAGILPKVCTEKMNPNLCMFPENFLGHIRTPIFLVQSFYDFYQLNQEYIGQDPVVGGGSDWANCLPTFDGCNVTQLSLLREFRSVFIKTLLGLEECGSRGMFVDSCYRHGDVYRVEGWSYPLSDAGNILNNKTIAQAVSDWYYDRSPFSVIDTKRDTPCICGSGP